MQNDAELNVSTSQEFTVPCHITNQSSKESEFQVTWFRQEALTGNKRQLIFLSYRNSTLQAFEKSDQLRFNRPLHKNYSLTVSKLAHADTGVYFCEVEEWLPSPSHGWRKIATQKSGYLTVNVFLQGQPLFENEYRCVADVESCDMSLLVYLCRRRRSHFAMQSCHMDHSYFGRSPSYCHICADHEDVPEQDRKEAKKRPLDRTSASEKQTLCRGINQTKKFLLFLNLTLYLSHYNHDITHILTN